MIKAILFDFGGVLAEEGFREGLKAIGQKNGLNADDFFSIAGELVYQTGYVTGKSDEAEFWHVVREKTGLAGDDKELRSEILKRFILRPKMLKLVEEIRTCGLIAAVLSDQTNWLDEIDRETPFYHYFDYVFNSFYLKKGKRDASIFLDVCSAMGLRPKEVLFVDDNIENITRALYQGLKVIYFESVDGCTKEIENGMKENRCPRRI
jgi:putative hydrolase of the HAD superfamily